MKCIDCGHEILDYAAHCENSREDDHRYEGLTHSELIAENGRPYPPVFSVSSSPPKSDELKGDTFFIVIVVVLCMLLGIYTISFVYLKGVEDDPLAFIEDIDKVNTVANAYDYSLLGILFFTALAIIYLGKDHFHLEKRP